jgi:DNA-directed RNA polymerase subunit N
MEFPVRCFSCGKVIGHLWEKYKKKVNEKESPEKVLNELGLERYCCRRMFISHVELVEDIIPYQRF